MLNPSFKIASDPSTGAHFVPAIHTYFTSQDNPATMAINKKVPVHFRVVYYYVRELTTRRVPGPAHSRTHFPPSQGFQSNSRQDASQFSPYPVSPFTSKYVILLEGFRTHVLYQASVYNNNTSQSSVFNNNASQLLYHPATFHPVLRQPATSASTAPGYTASNPHLHTTPLTTTNLAANNDLDFNWETTELPVHLNESTSHPGRTFPLGPHHPRYTHYLSRAT